MEEKKKSLPSDMEIVLNKVCAERTGMLFWDAWQKVGGTTMCQIVEQAMKEYAQLFIDNLKKSSELITNLALDKKELKAEIEKLQHPQPVPEISDDAIKDIAISFVESELNVKDQDRSNCYVIPTKAVDVRDAVVNACFNTGKMVRDRLTAKPLMSLDECKDEIAKKYEYSSFDKMEMALKNEASGTLYSRLNEAAQLYASQQPVNTTNDKK